MQLECKTLVNFRLLAFFFSFLPLYKKKTIIILTHGCATGLGEQMDGQKAAGKIQK